VTFLFYRINPDSNMIIILVGRQFCKLVNYELKKHRCVQSIVKNKSCDRIIVQNKQKRGRFYEKKINNTCGNFNGSHSGWM